VLEGRGWNGLEASGDVAGSWAVVEWVSPGPLGSSASLPPVLVCHVCSSE